MVFKFFLIFGGHKSFSRGHLYSYFGLLVTSTLGFKARVDSLDGVQYSTRKNGLLTSSSLVLVLKLKLCENRSAIFPVEILLVVVRFQHRGWHLRQHPHLNATRERNIKILLDTLLSVVIFCNGEMSHL